MRICSNDLYESKFKIKEITDNLTLLSREIIKPSVFLDCAVMSRKRTVYRFEAVK